MAVTLEVEAVSRQKPPRVVGLKGAVAMGLCWLCGGFSVTRHAIHLHLSKYSELASWWPIWLLLGARVVLSSK